MKISFAEGCEKCPHRPWLEKQAEKAKASEERASEAGVEFTEGSVICSGLRVAPLVSCSWKEGDNDKRRRCSVESTPPELTDEAQEGLIEEAQELHGVNTSSCYDVIMLDEEGEPIRPAFGFSRN